MSKVMLWGPCPWNRGAYGKNLLNLGLRLLKAGHEVTVFTMTGLQWGRLDYPVHECQVCHYVVHGKSKTDFCPVCKNKAWDSYALDCLPNNSEDYGQNWLQKWNALVKPDIVIFHYDIWPLGGYQTPAEIKRIAWYMPIDHSPCPPPVVATLNSAGGSVLAMTHFAEKELQKVGISASYIPHAVDMSIFHPGSRSEARQRLEFPEDCFLISCVGANTGPRKNLPNMLRAYSAFLERVPRAREKAFLYMHTNVRAGPANKQGYNLPQLWHNLGIIERIKYTHPLYYEAQGFTEAEMADVFRASDWSILVSLGEGFGLPYSESLACGTPVIYSNFAAAPEVVGPGGLPVQDVDRMAFELSSSFQWIPSTEMITKRMIRAFEDWESGGPLRNSLGRKGLKHVQQYSWEKVEPLWLNLVKDKVEPQPLEFRATLPKQEGEVDIIVITHNHLDDLLKRLMDSLYTRTSIPFHLIVVDDQSVDGTQKYLMDLWEKLGNVTYIRPAEKCKGGSEVMNIGFKYCRNDLLVSMNNDVEVLPGWLEEAVNVMQSDEKIGVVGMKFLYPDGKIQHAGGIFIKSGLPFHLGIGEPRESHSETREMPWVSGPCVLVRRLCLDPGWDEIYDTFGGHEDVDLCLRARAAGWKVLYCGKSEVYHHEGATVLNMPDFGHQHIRAREMFLARWSKNPMLK